MGKNVEVRRPWVSSSNDSFSIPEDFGRPCPNTIIIIIIPTTLAEYHSISWISILAAYKLGTSKAFALQILDFIPHTYSTGNNNNHNKFHCVVIQGHQPNLQLIRVSASD